jgi:ribosomal protein L27
MCIRDRVDGTVQFKVRGEKNRRFVDVIPA